MPIPQDRMATISLSVERRLNPISVPMRKERGTLKTRMLGRIESTVLTTVRMGASARMRSSVRRPNSRVRTAKVRNRRVIRKGGVISWLMSLLILVMAAPPGSRRLSWERSIYQKFGGMPFGRGCGGGRGEGG